MQIMRPHSQPDPLAGRVNVQVSLVYDLLVALGNLVYQKSSKYDIPAEWITKVRRRLLPETRATIDEIIPFFYMAKMPQPNTIEEFFEALEAMPAETFVDRLLFQGCYGEVFWNMIEKIRRGEILTDDESTELGDIVGDKSLAALLIKNAPLLTHQATIKARYIAALRDFYEAYFRREGERLQPILETSAQRARTLIDSKVIPARQLIEILTNGLTLTEDASYTHVVLAPSFHNAPFVTMINLPGEGLLILYPARPQGMSVDGESVDDEQLMRRLKALADKTRLEILRLLARRPCYNQELAEALHLTQPTISHHMRDLRVAGLVRVEESENTKRYSLRIEFIDQLADDLYDIFGLKERGDLVGGWRAHHR